MLVPFFIGGRCAHVLLGKLTIFRSCSDDFREQPCLGSSFFDFQHTFLNWLIDSEICISFLCDNGKMMRRWRIATIKNTSRHCFLMVISVVLFGHLSCFTCSSRLFRSVISIVLLAHLGCFFKSLPSLVLPKPFFWLYAFGCFSSLQVRRDLFL